MQDAGTRQKTGGEGDKMKGIERERDSVGTRMVDRGGGGQEALPADMSNKTKDKGRKRKHLHSEGGSQCSRQRMDDHKHVQTREHRRIQHSES